MVCMIYFLGNIFCLIFRRNNCSNGILSFIGTIKFTSYTQRGQRGPLTSLGIGCELYGLYKTQITIATIIPTNPGSSYLELFKFLLDVQNDDFFQIFFHIANEIIHFLCFR